MTTTEKARIMTTIKNKSGCKITGYFPDLNKWKKEGWKIIKQEMEEK